MAPDMVAASQGTSQKQTPNSKLDSKELFLALSLLLDQRYKFTTQFIPMDFLLTWTFCLNLLYHLLEKRVPKDMQRVDRLDFVFTNHIDK